MKKWITILSIVLIVVFATGCTSSEPKTYNNNGISFQYPGDWGTDYKDDFQKSLGNSSEILVHLGKDDTGIAVFKMSLGSLKIKSSDLASALKSNLGSRGLEFVSEKTRTVADVKGYEIVAKYTKSGHYLSLTFLEKNNTIYLIGIGTQDNNQQTIDMILNSFKVQ